jgi:hypothetical protein
VAGGGAARGEQINKRQAVGGGGDSTPLIVHISSPHPKPKFKTYIDSVVLCSNLKRMSNTVSPEKKRKPALFTLSPEAKEYVELKAKLFQRGSRGGQSEALNRMVMFCKEYEEGIRGGVSK